ncbi:MULTISPECIES: YfbR-like 5'-deoxynucleotidase [unclassified Cupriavidus]|jgi:5'-deoxynucleotidase YfbR-like HD superfamily hydrolase|uniref:YfbR-like 5'-deoxynucleotidase n=1 Tax=unclassified Cupriavidus TaxID=2640874 RepID=UPI001BFFF01F|nr:MULTISPECIES: YfbR-like 5'-deoxynucleotidase [unclassified Cupriavidus]MCA3194293.1 metal-dependent phosphohydrolase [Cupriavidus sp.]MCA3200401.1 metal-dependent phosphohydrolase [Cupriavidus sp.]MCA3233814.1 metal-dependent phosphohydrolase [Cupriavidus sp.]QWE95361.1 metal-dependent phosphohydrolase [Cupriavidus sp. EM10]
MEGTPTILLSTGRYFDFTNPCTLTVEEVAHALSKICRFTGHCRQFYSVAQHSVVVSRLVPKHLRKQALFHDAVETVVGDMVSPLKRLIPEYKALEKRCEAAILAGFGLPATLDPAVKHADRVALRTEQRDLMNKIGGLWTSLEGIEPDAAHIFPLAPAAAEMMFLDTYRDIERSLDAA